MRDDDSLEQRLEGMLTVALEPISAEELADVAEAVRRGDVSSGTEHYLRSGASEARTPNPQIKPAIEAWGAVLRDETAR